MKHLFGKWLAALLIAALLLTPVAMMEEAPAGEPVVTEEVNTDETPAEPAQPDETPAEPEPEPDETPDEPDETPAEPDETPDEPDETPAEPGDTVEDVEELIIAEAFEDSVEEASDMELDGEDADFTETLGEEVSVAESDALYAAGDIVLDNQNFPDQVLLNALKAFDDGDDVLSLAENQNVTTLNLGGSTFSDPTGLDKLVNLKVLHVNDCTSLVNLDVTGCTNLEVLGCSGNENLTTLNVSTCTNLKKLWIQWTGLNALPDLSNNTKLEDLQCAELGLTALNASAFPNLTRLGCGFNSLTQLDVSGCANLEELKCSGNVFSVLNLSNNKKLAKLWCEGNPNLKTLDISSCDVLSTSVDPNAPTAITGYGIPDYVGYAPFVDEWGDDWWRLTCDKGVTIIIKKAEAPAPAPAPAPVASAPAPATPVINATAKNTSTSITAAPGTIAQLNLGGAAGKSFKSSNKKVATVDKNGNITFKKAGKVKITFKVGKKKRTVKIKVTDPTLPTNVAFQPVNTAVKKGESVTLTPVVNEGANPGGFKWKSSNKKVATVKNGVVKFKKKGKVTITCTSKRGKKKAKIKFNVSK